MYRIMIKKTVTPRKRPTQKRSEERVRRILEATARLLETSGIEHVTALNVAEEAGIAVASFYQYFPNKNAVIYSLYQRWLSVVVERMDHLEASKYLKAPWLDFFFELSKHLIETPIYSRKVDRELHRAMEFIPDLRPLEAEHGRHVAERLAGFLSGYGCSWQRERLMDFAHFLYKASTSLYSNVVIDDQGIPRKRHLEWSHKTLVHLVAECFAD